MLQRRAPKRALRMEPGVALWRLECHIVRSVRTALVVLVGVGAATAAAAPSLDTQPAQPDNRSTEATNHPGPANELTIDLATAQRLAEALAPELAAAEAEQLGATGFQRAADRTLHRPPRVEVAIGPHHVPGAGRLGVDATLGIFQEFSTGSYGSELDRFATAAKQRAQSNRDALRREARVRATLSWLDALEAREILQIRTRAVQGAKETLRVAEARVTAGRSSPGEAALAQSLVGSAEAAVLAAEGMITVADAALRHVCRIELHRPLNVIGAIELPAATIDEQHLRQHVLEVAPDLLAVRSQAVAAEQAVKLGRAQSKPHLELGPSVTREGTGEWLFIGHLRMPLPGIDPAATENAERQLAAHLARAHVGIAEQSALRDVEIALHEREHAMRVRDQLKRGSIAPAERAAREAELQYEVGRTDLVGVMAARRELYDALEKWTRAAVDVRRAEAQLERYLATNYTQKGRPTPGAP